MKKKIIILAIAALVTLGTVFACFSIVNKPSTLAGRSVVNFIEDAIERDEFDLLKDTLTGGSISVKLDSITDEDGYDLLDDSYFEGTLYTSKKALMLSDINVQLYGNKFTGEFYISDKEMYVTENKYIGGSYGVKYKDLAEQLADSIFAAGSGSDYEIPDDAFDMITESIDSLKENQKIVKDLEKVGKKLVKEVWKIAANTLEFEKENSKERINGEKVSARIVSITINEENLAEFIEAVYEYICDSDLIIDFLEKYEDVFNKALEISGYDETIIDLYEEALEALGEELDYFVEDLEDYFEPITINLSLSKLTAKILKIEVKYNKTTVFSLDFGKKGLAKTDTITFKAGDVKATYKVKEDSKAKFNAEFVYEEEYSSYSESKYSGSLNIDKKSGKYEVKFEDSYVYNGPSKTENKDTYVVKGKYSKDGSAVTFTVDSVSNEYSYDDGFYTNNNKYSYKIKASITFNPKAKMPKPNKDYKTIADITKKDIEKWIEKFGELDF